MFAPQVALLELNRQEDVSGRGDREEQVRERQERIGLDWLIVPYSQTERFCSDVMPLL